MDNWWAETDEAILEALAGAGATTPADVARRVGISEGEATAFLTMLIREGKVRMCVVALRGAAEGEPSGSVALRGAAEGEPSGSVALPSEAEAYPLARR
ncbi:MAG TPA: winged helix-turn-helix domain-containing protein [Candidatus Nitrosotalea sp.]|jgi:DNA-binding Lrp family transcriptional regulator|nr:winged helix-turn-helix domain-containing protein [Candidatus Nitrosotalea sp.]